MRLAEHHLQHGHDGDRSAADNIVRILRRIRRAGACRLRFLTRDETGRWTPLTHHPHKASTMGRRGLSGVNSANIKTNAPRIGATRWRKKRPTSSIWMMGNAIMPTEQENVGGNGELS